MSDSATTVAVLRDCVRQFVDERDWRQFHTPKNLAMSIAIEAAELMEHFQWTGAARPVGDAPAAADAREAIGEELADILCYALSFANAMEIDISEAVRDKLRKNALKYPADQFRGTFR